MLTVGNKAPEFTLFDTDKQKVSLTDYKGKNLVMLFFPLAFTSVCTAELCSVRDNYNEYTKLNTEVIGISVDSLFTLGKFKAEQQYNFRLLSDFNKEVSKAYESLYDSFVLDMKGVSKRSAFIIDKDGILRYKEILENAGEQPDFQKIKGILEGLS